MLCTTVAEQVLHEGAFGDLGAPSPIMNIVFLGRRPDDYNHRL
jgi:hypothetical protein